jgi:ribosome-associated protein
VYRQRSTTLNRDSAPSAPEASDFDAESSSSDQVQTPFAGSVQDLIMARLDDDKAQDIVLIDLKDKSSVADAMIVASGRSARHVGALADHLVRALKDVGAGKARVEGLPHCDWVLIDAGDVIVHLFRPEVRAFYNLEKIWSVEPPKRAVAN